MRFFTVIRTVDDDGALVDLLHHPFEAAARHERIKACLALFVRRVARLADGVEVAADEPEGRAFDLLRVEKLPDDGVGIGLAIEDGVDIAVPLFVDGGGNEVGGARVVDDEHRLSVLDADKAGEGFKGNIIVAVDMRAIKAQDADVALEALLPHHLHEEVQFLRRFFDGLAVIFQRAQTAVDDLVVHLRHHGDAFGQLILHVFVQHHVQLMLDAVADQAEAAEREDEQHDEAALLGAEEIFFKRRRRRSFIEDHPLDEPIHLLAERHIVDVFARAAANIPFIIADVAGKWLEAISKFVFRLCDLCVFRVRDVGRRNRERHVRFIEIEPIKCQRVRVPHIVFEERRPDFLPVDDRAREEQRAIWSLIVARETVDAMLDGIRRHSVVCPMGREDIDVRVLDHAGREAARVFVRAHLERLECCNHMGLGVHAPHAEREGVELLHVVRRAVIADEANLPRLCLQPREDALEVAQLVDAHEVRADISRVVRRDDRVKIRIKIFLPRRCPVHPHGRASPCGGHSL